MQRSPCVQLLCTIAVILAAPERLKAQAPDSVRDDAKLPQVVLIGDSIRLSYAPIVAQQLKGKAVVVSPKANGGDSSNLKKHLEHWIIKERPDVVHFNCGIHDTKKFSATGKFQVPPAEYESNLRTIVNKIREETDAVVLFATTTPIIDDRAAAARRGREYTLVNSSVVQYNLLANRVMKELKTPVNDLHRALLNPKSAQVAQQLIGKDGVHLTDAGKEILGKKVAAFIAKRLPGLPPNAK